MNDRQLRYACAVWRERSFSRAAKKLRVSQPSISEQVRLLEEEIGFPIFHRGPRGIETRTVGEAFLEKAEQVLDGIANLDLLGRQLRGESGARLRIGINSGLDKRLVSRVVGLVSAELHDVRYEIVTATSRRILRLMNQDRLDIGFLLGADLAAASPKIAHAQLGAVDIVAFVAEEHPLARHEGPAAFDDIAHQPLIITDAHVGVGHLVFNLFRAHERTPNVVADSDDMETIKAMVASEVGIALLPADAIEPTDGVSAVPIQGRPCAGVDMVHAAKAESPLVDVCVARLREELTASFALELERA